MRREKAKRIAMSLLLLLFATFVQAQGNKITLNVTKEPLPSALNTGGTSIGLLQNQL